MHPNANHSLKQGTLMKRGKHACEFRFSWEYFLSHPSHHIANTILHMNFNTNFCSIQRIPFEPQNIISITRFIHQIKQTDFQLYKISLTQIIVL